MDSLYSSSNLIGAAVAHMQGQPHREQSEVLTTMLDLECDVPAAEIKRNRTYHAGNTVRRQSDVQERLQVGADGQQLAPQV